MSAASSRASATSGRASWAGGGTGKLEAETGDTTFYTLPETLAREQNRFGITHVGRRAHIRYGYDMAAMKVILA